MCEITVFINENGTSKRIARSIVKVDAGEGCVSLLHSSGRVIKVDGTIILTVDLLKNEIALKKND